MKVLILCDSFKDCLSSLEVSSALENGILKAIPGTEIIKLPIADGGEGTVQAFVAATGGEIIPFEVKDPLLRNVKSFYGMLPEGTAVIEMAAASGIELLTQEERNPMLTSTYGVGQLILKTLDKGATTIILGLGGSATNDGGTGMAKALGFRFLDKNGVEINEGGGALSQLVTIDKSKVDPRLAKVNLIAACDVSNVLTGELGASAVYGPQKGATSAMVKQLDHNLKHLASIIEKDLGLAVSDFAGAGAAGGLGAGTIAFANGELKPGFQILKETLRLEEKIKKVDMVITGEGRMDDQTQNGKAPYSVMQLAKQYDKKVIAFAGSLGKNVDSLYALGFDSVFPIAPGPVTLAYSLEHADELLSASAERVFRLLNLSK